MANPNEIPASKEPQMAGCQQEPCCASSEPLHVYDWLDQPAADENERLAKEWLNKFSKPAYDKYKSGAGDWLAAHALTVEWRGQRYWCRGCSRMGDVWITKDPTGATYYDHRVNVEELSNWKRFDDARGNLQHNAKSAGTDASGKTL